MSEAPRRNPAASQQTARGLSEARSTPSRSDATLTGALYGTLFLLGFGVGVYGAFYSTLSVWVVPVGAVTGIVVNFVMCWAIRRGLRARLPAVLAAAGWLIAVSLLSMRRPEGDLVITGGRAGYLLILGGTVAAAVAVTARSGRRGGPERHGR